MLYSFGELMNPAQFTKHEEKVELKLAELRLS